eukprot:TRINITY_DN3880_c0_g1_i1.p1 TRINITY_DN3880_c0_g1~~TRINITY_DN3880_c0_g1_i1.p1  ORF type:complete len:511 (-),score=150.12 TRINITY_DN3880_c0_g1_i1:28-1560(-)
MAHAVATACGTTSMPSVVLPAGARAGGVAAVGGAHRPGTTHHQSSSSGAAGDPLAAAAAQQGRRTHSSGAPRHNGVVGVNQPATPPPATAAAGAAAAAGTHKRTHVSKRAAPEKGKDGKESPPPADFGLEPLPHAVRANGILYFVDRVIGNGSFGVVLAARCESTGEIVAIKRVLQDRRYKNRELQIMRGLHHPHVVELKNSFFANSPRGDDVFLNLVLEFLPDTMHKFARDYVKRKQPVPLILVKLFMYQLGRALAYIHSFNVCHRDIKPQNLLLDAGAGVLKLCDFGSAKVLQRGEPNVCYICSRYYRAPELIFGSTTYTTAIDVWSMGCVFAELLLGQPLFPGSSSVDELVEIIKVLGTPSYEQIQAMNKNYPAYSFPDIKPHPWNKILKNATHDAIDLVSHMLQYAPAKRPTALEACAHPFFDELRNTPNLVMPNGNAAPPVFNFTSEELAAIKQQGLEKVLLPRQVPAQASSPADDAAVGAAAAPSLSPSSSATHLCTPSVYTNK